jgi:DNA-binding IscR family transcriptional regulator
MPLLHRKSRLAVAAETDVALNGPVTGQALAKHLYLRPRHLEPVLQALVREGILKTVRGPGGGYVAPNRRRRHPARGWNRE